MVNCFSRAAACRHVDVLDRHRNVCGSGYRRADRYGALSGLGSGDRDDGVRSGASGRRCHRPPRASLCYPSRPSPALPQGDQSNLARRSRADAAGCGSLRADRFRITLFRCPPLGQCGIRDDCIRCRLHLRTGCLRLTARQGEWVSRRTLVYASVYLFGATCAVIGAVLVRTARFSKA